MDWYYAGDGGQQVGPVGDDQVLALIGEGKISKNTMTWNDTMPDWAPAAQTSLAPHFQSARLPPPLQQAVPPPVAPAIQSAGSSFQRDPNMIYPSNPPKSPHLCWLNMLWSGIAQCIYGQTAKGITLIFAELVGLLTCILFVIVAIASIIDAYMVGKALAAGKPVGKWQFFPKA